MDNSERLLNTLLLSVIADLLEKNPAHIPRLARRLLPVLANQSIPDHKRYEIIRRIYGDHYGEDVGVHRTDLKMESIINKE